MSDTSPTTAGRIFISYRREDTAYPAGWLYDRLADRFGGNKIFKDIDSIELGDDFVEVITNAVASCDVLLALVGDQWLTITDEEGKRRLDDPADFVRVEIEAALARNVRVIPVLVDGATMPRADEVPTSLAKLVRRQALELSPDRFDFDTGRLLRVLDRTLGGVQATPAAEEPQTAVLTVWTEQDEAVQHRNPSTQLIRQLVSELPLPGHGNGFLVIQRQDRAESYAQIARNAADDFLAEFRHGDGAQHLAASHLSLPAAQAALCGWAFDLPGWQDRLQWSRLPSADTTEEQAVGLDRARSPAGMWVPSHRSTQDAATATTAVATAPDEPTTASPAAAGDAETDRGGEHPATRGRHRRRLRRKWSGAAAAVVLALALMATGLILWNGGGGDDDGSVETGQGAGGWSVQAPVGVAVGAEGVVYVAESTAHRVTVIDDGAASTVAGGSADESDYGDGGPATSATLAAPRGVAVTPDGDLYIADRYHAMVRRVTEDGTITRFAGTGETGSSGDGGPASRAQLTEPHGVAVGSDGSVYIADSEENRVRRVDTDGTITTVAGTGEEGFSGDDGPAIEATLHWPSGIAVASDGTLYIADTDNHRIRRIAANGTITTVAGTGEAGFTSDDLAATDAALDGPQAVALASDGTLYIADTGNNRIRRIADGTITSVAGTGEVGNRGDDGPATSASLAAPQGIAFAPDGTLYIADTDNNRIRRIADGTMTTV